MKISYNWLKKYLSVDLPAEQVAEALTSSGLEVEDTLNFESVKGSLRGIVTGHVISCERHPNADRLSLTKVDVGGEEPLSIVCGAPNVAAGQKVLVATIGTTLYAADDSFQIKKSKIRGEVSEGMICAEDELGLGTSHDGILVLPEDTAVGQAATQLFEVVEDKVFEIGLTPNRSDATSHIGVARDLAAVLNFRAGEKKYSLQYPSVDDFKVDNHNLDIDVVVEDAEACPRYSGLTISDLKVGPSPDWLQNSLKAVGIRPINNVVDVTNYVLFETGQPLHAFDAKAIKGEKVVVKTMPEGTAFVTLDETERKLSANDLMICNVEEPMCIGGVFGGLHSGVTGQTTSIFLESACFDARYIRKTSKYHGLQTDASFRFERGADPSITVYALQRAAMLIKEVAGGHISSEIKDVLAQPIVEAKVDLSFSYVNKLAGQHIEPKQVVSILTDLGLTVQNQNETLVSVAVPTYKVDVTRPADLVEEVLRVYGYDNIRIPEKLNASINAGGGVDLDKVQHQVADTLSAAGYYEIMNNSLTKSSYAQQHPAFDADHSVKILNPLSTDLDVMRQTLLFGGLESIAYNQNRKMSNLRFYEFGKVYRLNPTAKATAENTLAPYAESTHLDLWITGNKQEENWSRADEAADFYDLKFIVEGVLHKLGFENNQFQVSESDCKVFEFGLSYQLNNQQVAAAGQLATSTTKPFDIRKPVFYATINWTELMKQFAKQKLSRFEAVPKFPAVRRDLALVIDQKTRFEEIEAIARKAEPALLQSVNLFDVYEGEKIPQGKKSYATSFILLDKEKTLTDKVIEKSMQKIFQALQQQLGASLR